MGCQSEHRTGEQAEELRAQGEELQTSNEELRVKSDNLQQQTEELRVSEEELRSQREALQLANTELEEKSRGLEEQARQLEEAREEADQRALERDTASRYKSEFLSNMSHELRTPLNSLLILARSLSENDGGNLNDDQIESAKIIFESGAALLNLINDILDLSKVEAGKMEIHPSEISLAQLSESLRRRFRAMAEVKGLSLNLELDTTAPERIRTDSGKLDQILNNLIGNAIKFTDQGGVTIRMAPASGDDQTPLLAISIHDSGIGIEADKLAHVFNAFEQVDGAASRRYGGTGLGLTISRRLAQLLGGNVLVTSALGEGSTFTLTLPFIPPTSEKAPRSHPAVARPAETLDPPTQGKATAERPAVDDDRDRLSADDETILIIEDDANFAKTIRDLSRQRGFKCLVACDGNQGLALARHYRPTGIVLDVGLPGIDGWQVMETLKQQPETRPIPVHFISANDASQRGLEMGAVGYFVKPVDREQIDAAFERIRHFGLDTPRRLLLVEDDEATRVAVGAMLAGLEVQIVSANTGQQALEQLQNAEPFDCVILDLGLPDISGFELLDECARHDWVMPPVIIYSARELSEEETLTLKQYTDSIVIKGARSPERLLDEVTLFLHSVHQRLPSDRRRQLEPAEKHPAEGLAGRTILVVDDDMRNAFALSKVLRAAGMTVLMAQDGDKALKQLDERSDIDLVLMDIMMPGMDGYTAIAELRKRPGLATLPVIALTAKAMTGDREKCLDAGANGYLSKPVDIDALLELMRKELIN